MLLSVVIIGRNEGERLRLCLESVQALRRPDFDPEVIYVDSSSSDGSVALAAAHGARTIVLTAPRTTAAMGRNCGWQAASGTFVLFLDGDTVLQPGFVGAALPAFEDFDVAVVWGHRREGQPQASVYNRVLDLDWIYAPGFTSFCGGDALFRRSVLQATGGFDETLIAGEEPELCRRITAVGGKILHVDTPMTTHDLAITRFRQYWRRATRAGHAYAEVSERFRSTPDQFWLADAMRNRRRAMMLVGVFTFAALLSLVLLRVWPLVALLLLFTAVCARTAWKARWKTRDRVALALYGVHSQLQQIPIFWGQLQFRRNHRRGLRAGLVEYKRS